VTTKKLTEEKRKISEGIWDLDPAAMEKAEHAFSGQPCKYSLESAAFGRGSAFGMEAARNDTQGRSHPT